MARNHPIKSRKPYGFKIAKNDDLYRIAISVQGWSWSYVYLADSFYGKDWQCEFNNAKDAEAEIQKLKKYFKEEWLLGIK